MIQREMDSLIVAEKEEIVTESHGYGLETTTCSPQLAGKWCQVSALLVLAGSASQGEACREEHISRGAS